MMNLPQGWTVDEEEQKEETKLPQGWSIEKEETEEDKFKREAGAFYVPTLNSEQFKNLSISEKLQYAKDKKEEREYLQMKGTTKGILSGLSFGGSQNIEALKPGEVETGFGFGEILGSALPITKLMNIFTSPLVKFAAKSPILQRQLTSLARVAGVGVGGAAYE